MKPRPTASFLLLTMALQMAAQWVLPLAGLAVAKKKSGEEIFGNFKTGGKKESRIFHFSASDFQKMRIGKREFRHEGFLFDIEQIAQTLDSVQVTAHHDLREQKILTAIEGFLKPDDSGLPGGNSLVSKLLALAFGQVFLVPETPVLPVFEQFVFVKTNFSNFLPGSQDWAFVFYPPPEVG